MNTEKLISEALSLSPNAIGYTISQNLAASFPDRAIVEGNTSAFDLEEYAKSELCVLERSLGHHNQIETEWEGMGKGVSRSAENAWYLVRWEGHDLEVLLVTYCDERWKSRHHWILAETRDVAERFFVAVCEWASEVRGEVLVYDQGCWYKSEPLFDAIRGASFDNLILRGALKAEIQADFNRFLDSRATYEQYGIPWKRGVLFVGPPGNGKTHAVKALVNRLKLPCLYVKSFKSEYGTEHGNIHSVFERARQTTPCVLVLEDLDSLINDKIRSFFLNELDGFACNTGVIVLATTNHPDKLDPAIVDRPSRFDRKYHFELPAVEERASYLAMWNSTVQPDLRLTGEGIRTVVASTDGYSFAYLKELWLSSLMRWMNRTDGQSMDEVMAEQAVLLREQMAYGMGPAVPEPALAGDSEDEDDD